MWRGLGSKLVAEVSGADVASGAESGELATVPASNIYHHHCYHYLYLMLIGSDNAKAHALVEGPAWPLGLSPGDTLLCYSNACVYASLGHF